MKFFDTKYMYAILALIVFGSFCFGALFYKVVIDDSPSPVVDTVYVDSLDWMVSRWELVDSIAVLNEALDHYQTWIPSETLWVLSGCDQVIDSLKQHVEWLWWLRELADVPWVWPPYRSDTIRFDTGWQPIVVRVDTIYDPVYKTPDPCAGIIEAVDSFWVANTDTSYFVLVVDPYDYRVFTDRLGRADSSRVMMDIAWPELSVFYDFWQRLTERSR